MNGANVNCTTSENQTPLHLACQYGHLEISKILLENNACLTLKNKAGKMALEIAKEKKHKRIYRIIYEKMISALSTSENQISNVDFEMISNAICIKLRVLKCRKFLFYHKCFRGILAIFRDAN